MENIYKDGIVPDPRTEEEKARDYKHSEVAGAMTLNWIEKPKDQWKKYTPREQDGSLSCCGQGSAKGIEILNKTVMSAHPPYRSRSNYPDGGMYLQNIGEVWKKVGSTTEALDPSQRQNESTMNRDIAVPTPVKSSGYAFPSPKSIDEIAEAIELHGHCILIVHCSKSEWTAIPQYNGSPIEFGHCICAVDYFLHDGKKSLLIEDSTGHANSLDGNGQRIITEDFLKARFEGAIYLTIEALILKHKFFKVLRIGMYDPEVGELQKVLKIKVDSRFGKDTLAAVKNFQIAHGLVSDGVVGEKTNAVLNSL